MKAAGRADGGSGHIVRRSPDAIKGEDCGCGLTICMMRGALSQGFLI